MMTSFSPGANIRPAIMRTFSWIWVLTGSTPRMGRLSKVSPAGINTCSASSGETSGLPTPSRLMAGRNLSASNWSSVINELASESALRPRRIMLSGALLSLIAESRPPTIAMAATKTPTTMAMAPTVMALDTRRTSRLRRLYLKGMAIGLIHQSEGFNDAAFGGGTRGNIRAQHTDKRRHAQGLRQHKKRNMQGDKRAKGISVERENLEQSKRHPATNRSSRYSHNQRFAHQQTQDHPRGKSYRAHDGDFAPTLANGHGRGVCRDQPNGHDGHQAEQRGQFHENTIAIQNAAYGRCFRSAAGFCRGIGELVINRGSNFRHHP